MTDVLTDWKLHVELDAALRAQAADPAELRRRRPQIVDLSVDALREADRLVSPLVLSRRLVVHAHESDALELETGRLACGVWVAGRLAEAEEVVGVICTIGHALEDRVSAIFPSDPAAALALDGAGSAAVDALAAEACQRFGREAARRDLAGTVQCWPGSARWPLDVGLPQIFALADPGCCEVDRVQLLPSMLMRPVKSIAFILGLTARATATEDRCGSCSLGATCRYRPRERQGSRPEHGCEDDGLTSTRTERPATRGGALWRGSTTSTSTR